MFYAPPHPKPLPQLRWRRGRHVRRVFGNTGDWISRTVIHQPENVLAGILSPGERTQVRAGVNTNFRVATMPLVTPGVNGLGCSMFFAV